MTLNRQRGIAALTSLALLCGFLAGCGETRVAAGTASPTATAQAPASDSPEATDGSSFFRTDPDAIIQLGMADRPGGASALAEAGIAQMRYQYLSGGIETGNGWQTWTPDNTFVRDYIDESTAAGLTSVFTYYMAVQSLPDDIPEAERDLRVLNDADLMGAYFRDLDEFFSQSAHAAPGEVVLHLEPDLWGFAQQEDQDPTSIPVALEGASGTIGNDLPTNLAGFAQSVLRLRDERAPNVAVAYHMSFWGAGADPILDDASDNEVDDLADRSVEFYQALGADFDLTFTELGDRDAGFRQEVYGQGDDAWWTPDDFARHARYVERFSTATQQDIVLWQIPYGNTQMRALNNTWNHFQDNKVEWLLGDASKAHLEAYRAAGVVALLFGRGADGATDASDANEDGKTDPPAINGNDTRSLSADDDGGYFRSRAEAYLSSGGVPLTPAAE